MLNNTYSAESISECLGIDHSTVYRYWDLYKTDSIHLYTDSRSVAKWVKDNLGVEIRLKALLICFIASVSAIKRQRSSPCECREEEQFVFMRERSEVLEDLDEDTMVYYTDGVHPTHNSRSALG